MSKLLVSAFLASTLLLTLVFFRKRGPPSGFCATSVYRDQALKLIDESPFAGLFRDLRNQTKFEASGVAYDSTTDSFLAVFDSSMSVARFDARLRFRGDENVLIGERVRESQFEGISPFSVEDNTWLLLAEAVPGSSNKQKNKGEEGVWYPEITLAQFHQGSNSYDVVERCRVDFELTHENKGFESIIYLPEKELLLGLCEGNYCVGGKRGRDRGHGKIVVSKLTRGAGGCQWTVVDMLDVPNVANFQDYSAMAIRDGKMAILSQEDAALALVDFDKDTVNFGNTTGVVMHLPRDVHCNIVFCNAEGIAFVDPYRFLIVSDKAKKAQPMACRAHDQSVALFAVPSGFLQT